MGDTVIGTTPSTTHPTAHSPSDLTGSEPVPSKHRPTCGQIGRFGSIVRPVRFPRITTDPHRMGGVPCIRDLRFPVATVVAMIADGMTVDEILAEHPDLEPEDIAESLRYAALAVQERELPLRQPA